MWLTVDNVFIWKDQIKKIEPLVTVRMEKMMEFRQAGMEREAMQAEMKKLNDAQLESLKAILISCDRFVEN